VKKIVPEELANITAESKPAKTTGTKAKGTMARPTPATPVK